jgi:NAD(P)-dependent dehydrogenase (short-subunit alcohol dehydrogenase family)
MSDRKWILVTGAASGIGRATAEYLANNGFGVYATDIEREHVEELNQLDNIIALKMDITKDEDVDNAFKGVSERGNGLFALVNNAGIYQPGPLMDFPMERFMQVFRVNVFGTQRVSMTFFPLIHESKGRIVNMSSVAGFIGLPFSGAYAATKHAIEGWSDSLRRELAFLDVRVIIIEPGMTNTPLWSKDFEGRVELFRGSVFYEANRAKLESQTREGIEKGLDPVEIAKVVYGALTEENPRARYLVDANPDMLQAVRSLPDEQIDEILVAEMAKWGK